MSGLFSRTSTPKPVEVAAQAEPVLTRGLTQVWRARKSLDEQEGGCGASLVDRVLHARDLAEDVDAYLNPSLRSMHDPTLIPDLQRAAARILSAVQLGERIVIFGDYDVDGVTASAILIHTLRAIAPNADVISYIPHRVEEGYGLNCEAIRSLHADGASLVVTVDCGITAIQPAQTASELGVELIITDHHNPPATLADLPKAYAVVHPRRPDSSYPFGELCGAGVAYKLAWQLCTMHCGSERVNPKLREVLIEMLAFAALGSIADVVPLVDENRVIVKHGLRQVPHSRNEGLRALIEASGLDSDKVDTEDVGFRLAPRLNAIGRLGHAAEALELMTNATGDQARQLAERLSKVNTERKSIGDAIFTQAEEMAKAAGMCGEDQRAIVLAHPEWHPGVVGIVCSRLVERYARPVILMQRDGGICKGSGRSIDGFNLHAGLEACSAHLTGFGGHDMAAGMRCDAGSLEAFTESFIQYTNGVLKPADLVNTVRYDTQARLTELSVEAVRSLERLAPFGAGNPRVRLRLLGAKLNGPATTFGRAGNHLSLRVCDRSHNTMGLRVVAWNWAQHLDQIPPGAPVELIIEPAISTWNGRTTIEPTLIDLRVC